MTPMPHLSLRLCAAALAATLGLAAPARAEPVAVTAAEFKLYKEYLNALEDERVQKIPENKRLKEIAKNFRVSEKALQAAIDKGTAAGEVGRKLEVEVRGLLEASALKGRLHELRVDDGEPLIVTYVAWKVLDPAKLEQEASLAAHLAAKGAPITHTIALWAVDAAGRKVFEGKIDTEKASRFNPDRLEMFAATRYIKQFEGVVNAYKPAAAPAPAPAAPGAN